MDLISNKAKSFLLEHSNFHFKKERKNDMVVYDITSIRLGDVIKITVKEKVFCNETGKLLKLLTDESNLVPRNNIDLPISVDFESLNCKCFVKFKSLSKYFNEEVSNRISKLKLRYRDLSSDVTCNEQTASVTFVRTMKNYNK